jgi:DNA polymerase V
MRKNIYALVDCNNFYVSCERVFHASIQHKPVIVLSNNDGCVVARSNEAKKVGIKMGQPVFKCEELIRTHNIQVFSSNYSLYADMSARVMKVLSHFSPRLEVYSIDEAFVDLSQLAIDDLTEFGRVMKAQVLQFTGIPVSVGIANTKTLCKIANEIVKKDARYEGVLDLTTLSGAEIDEALAKVAVEDVWGIGYKYSLFLMNHGILTARDLKYADEKWIRRYLTVVGERTVLELRGTACIPLETERPAKKGIMCSKSFGREVTRLDELEEIVATYTARAAEKLRGQDSLTCCITVFLRTNAFKKDTPQYANSFSLRIPYPTAFTPELTQYALNGLKAMYRDGYNYKKAGVFLTKIIPREGIQPDLFNEFSLHEHYKQARLMFIVDAINKIYGRDTLFFAVQGITRPWKMRQSRLSGRFTTQWSEILTI